MSRLERGGLPVSAQQAAVVDHLLTYQVTVVGAGAGSGKTHTTVAAALEMLARGEASLDEFVLITFTNKAADELRARLEEELTQRQRQAPDPAMQALWRAQRERLSGAFLGTIHGFCSQILRTFGYEGGVARQAQVSLASTPLQEAIEAVVTGYLGTGRGILLGPALTWREYELREQVRDILDEIHNRGLDARALYEETKAQPADPGQSYRLHLAILVARAEEAYQTRKREAQVLDTSDLLLRTAILLTSEQGPEIVRRLTERHRHLFIDEFQDTDQVQKRIVDALLPSLETLLVVGDRKQSIYGFRAAEASLLEQVAAENGVEMLPLSISRRPTGTLLALQNTLFQRMSDRYPALGETLAPWEGTVEARGNVPPLTYLSAGYAPNRADGIRTLAEHLQELLRSGEIESPSGGTRPVVPGDIAVLVRTNSQLRAYEEGLRAAGLPARADAGGKFFEQPEIVATYYLLRLLLHYPDETKLVLALRTPYLAAVDLTELVQQALQYEMRGRPLTDRLEGRYPEVARDIAMLRNSIRSDTVPQLLARLYDTFSIQNWYRARGDAQAADNLERLRDLARGLFREEQALTLREFVGWLEVAFRTAREEREAEEVQESRDTPWIRLLSIHRAKGLEFPIVAIPEVQAPVQRAAQAPGFLVVPGYGLDVQLPVRDLDTRSPRFDEALQVAQRASLEEEMRIFYVVVTRAQHGVVLVGNGRQEANNPGSTYYSWKDELMRARRELERLGAYFRFT